MPPSEPPPSNDSPTEDIETARRKAPWTQQFRRAVLVLLGAAAFVLFLYFMLLKARGNPIEYTDLFLLLATSGTLLGINFSLDLLSALADTGRNDGNGGNNR